MSKRARARMPASPLVLLLAVLLPGPSPSMAQEGADPVTDLSSLTSRAERTFPTVAAADQAIEAARAQLAEAKISPYFQLEATAAFAVMPDAQGTPAYSPDSQLPIDNQWGPATRVGVEGAIPLYTFGKLKAARQAAKAGVEAAEAGRTQSLAELRFDVRRAYFGLQMALDLQQMVSEGRPKLADALERMEEKLADDDPDVNIMDKWRLASALAEVDARASEAQRLESTTRAALETLSGVSELRVPPCPLETVEFDPRPVERYVDRALTTRPETRKLEAAVKARDADVTRHKAGYLPDLGLALGASFGYAPGVTNQNNPFVLNRANRRTLGAALVARWSLDLWGNVHRVRRAKAQHAETAAQARAASEGIRIEVTKAYQSLEDARRREEAWAGGERQGRSWFVAAVQGYQVGTAEPKDLVDALKAYFTARFNHLMAIREHNEALAELERVSGAQLVAPDGWESACGE
ncbi:MAG: TolC family protein [Myxococcota bacterium]